MSPLRALVLSPLIACGPVKAGLESGGPGDSGGLETGEGSETGSPDTPDSGDTGGSSSTPCALVDGALPLAPEGDFLALESTISGDRTRCTSALHAAAGAAGSTLSLTLESWSGVGGATVTALDLLGVPIAGPLALSPGASASFTLVQTGEVLLRIDPEDPDEDSNSYTLSLACSSGCDAEYTRYPVVLMHGMGGTDTYVGLLDYYFEVSDTLTEAGYRVETPSVDAFATIPDRAAQWQAALDALVAEGVGRRFVLVAHSQGGLDARYLLSSLHDTRVAALVTVATPHRGSAVADAASGVLDLAPLDGAVVDAAIAALVGIVGLDGDELSAQIADLSTSNMEAFNTENPDVDGVYYASWAGRSCGALDWSCQWDNNGEVVDPLLGATELLLELTDGDNDGMVSVESATWGDYQGELPADHLDEVGQIADVWNPSFDHPQFYLDEVRRLAALGY